MRGSGQRVPKNSERELTQTRHVIVEHREQERLPAERGEHSADNADDRGDGEDGEAKIVELLVPVSPGHRWERLLGLESMGNIVVGNVQVDGNVASGRCRWLHGRLGR